MVLQCLYQAPEILRTDRYDARADLWSVGTILYELLTNRPPFTGQNPMQLLRNIEKKEVRFPSTISISDGAKHLIEVRRHEPRWAGCRGQNIVQY